MTARTLATLAAAVGLLAADLDPQPRRHRPPAPVRTRLEQAYRTHANRRRKLALASKRLNWRRA